MADQIENCDVNNTLLSLNTFNTNERDDFVDDKVHISETVIIVNNFESQDHMRGHDTIRDYEASNILDNIKAELPSSEGQYNVIKDNVKIEEGIGASNIKIEFDNQLLYCDDCQANYEDYCIKCGMLVHILNRYTPNNSDIRTQDELPNDIVQIQHLFGQCGILALRVIPERVKFGPFTGLCRTECAWRIRGGKFVVDKDRLRYLNWMQYVNPARNTFEGNLIVIQCEDYLYYRSTRQIQPGEELLIYFGKDFTDSLNGNVDVDFIPTTEHIINDVFACTFCCLGFISKSCLAKHKTICLRDAGGDFSFEDLTQCPFCKIHLGQKEYFEHHFPYCSERNVRKYSPPTLSSQITAVKGRKTRRSHLYKCEQCKYRTKYKADLKKHTNSQHYKVKSSKCGVCYRRFKTKKYLRSHVENTHFSHGREEDPAHSRHDYLNAYIKYIKVRQSTNHEQSSTNHIKSKRLNEFDPGHSRCDYATTHIKVQQSSSQGQTQRFKCCLCGFRSKHKQCLTKHIKSKHLNEFDFNCDSCEFRTNLKDHLQIHLKTKHLNQFDYNCASCKYRTNVKINFKTHIKTKHLKKFDFKCDSCEYKTNYKGVLKSHIKIKHLKVFNFKCDKCEFRTNHKDRLIKHIKAKHLKEFDYKCDYCEFRTNNKYHFEAHIKSKHLNEFDYKCDLCEFRTNYKSGIKNHINTHNLKKRNFKCDSCEFRTNYKVILKSHINTQHLNM